MGSEQHARKSIDQLLAAAGWAVQDFKAADIHAARGAIAVTADGFSRNPRDYALGSIDRWDFGG